MVSITILFFSSTEVSQALKFPHIASTNGSRAAWLFQCFPSFALAATLARLCSRCWCMRSSWNQIPVSTVCHLPGDHIKYLTKTRVCQFAITSVSIKMPPFTLICDPFSGFPYCSLFVLIELFAINYNHVNEAVALRLAHVGDVSLNLGWVSCKSDGKIRINDDT